MKYCNTDKDQKKHCHVFKEGVYKGFETDGELSINYSPMIKKWIKESKTEKDLASFLLKADFKQIL